MRNIILILGLFLSVVANAQPPRNFFTKFGGNGIDVGYGVKQTFDKQYIVVGSSTSYGTGYSDFYLLRVDSMGQLIWQKNYGGFNNDVAKSVIQLPIDSGFVITGFTNSYGNGGYDIMTIRTDKAGTIIWQRTFGGLDWDFGYDLVQANDGNIIICGSTSSFGNGKSDGCLLKYDVNGNLIWQKFFGGIENDGLNAIIKTNDNLIACVGVNKSISDINGNGYFLKLNLNGDTIFTKNFGGAYTDFATDLTQIANGNYIVVGAKTFHKDSTTRSYMTFYSTTGSFIKDTMYYNSKTDEHWVAIANSYAGVNMWATIRNVPVPDFGKEGNIFLYDINYSFYGKLPYAVNSFGGVQDETFYAIDKTKDSGTVCVGITHSYGASNGDLFIMKQDLSLITHPNVIGIKENESEVIEVVLKNQSNYLYQIEFNSDKYRRLFITDLCGKVILDRKIESKLESISLNDYSPGLYILTAVSVEGKAKSFKLIK